MGTASHAESLDAQCRTASDGAIDESTDGKCRPDVSPGRAPREARTGENRAHLSLDSRLMGGTRGAAMERVAERAGTRQDAIESAGAPIRRRSRLIG
jgi:hypothetical protein